MEEKYIYVVDFKKGSWDDFCGMITAASEEVAKRYIDHNYPNLNWFEKHRNQYARRKNEDGTIVTYRIRREWLVTQAYVDELNKRKAARDQKAAQEGV